MDDYSHILDKDLADLISHYRKRIYGDLRLDEGSDEAEEKRYFAIKDTLNKMEEEARRRGIEESQIYTARTKGEERERRIRLQIENLERISYAIINNPSDVFDSETTVLRKDTQFRSIVQGMTRNKAEKITRDHELLKRKDRSAVLKIFGKDIILAGNELGILPKIRDDGQIMFEYIQCELYDNHALVFFGGYEDLRKLQEITRNIYWVNSKDVAKEYIKGVDFLAERDRKGEKHEVKLSDLLDFNKVELIVKSFTSPTFIQWFYKRELPAYSWSAKDGEPMMKALTTGEYSKSYDAEMGLIRMAQRDIGERYGLGKN